jgi:hypothetical protein
MAGRNVKIAIKTVNKYLTKNECYERKWQYKSMTLIKMKLLQIKVIISENKIKTAIKWTQNERKKKSGKKSGKN